MGGRWVYKRLSREADITVQQDCSSSQLVSSPISQDCVHVQLYRDSKERYNNGQTKASLSLQYFLAVQSGFTLDKESNTIAILCEDVTVIFAFDTREQLIQWQAKIAINLGEDEQYLVQISSAPARSKVVPGPARLHVLEGRFCLTEGVPPRLLGHWQIAHLRKYGVINNRFCFEGGSQCSRGEGLYVLLTDRGEDISRALRAAAHGNTPLALVRAATPRYLQGGRERSISSSRTEANLSDRLCADSLQLDWDHRDRSRSQENLCWNPPGASPYDDTPCQVSRPRCRSCHVKLARSSTVTCAPGMSFTWTMESCGGSVTRSPSCLEQRSRSTTPSTIRGVSPCCAPPRPPKTKHPQVKANSALACVSKRPRPSPSMPAISRCACSPSTAIVEMGEEYYDTPRSFKKAVYDHSLRPNSCCSHVQPQMCVCPRAVVSPRIPYSVSLSQGLFVGHTQAEHRGGCHNCYPEHTSGRDFSVHHDDEPTSLASDPGWHPEFRRNSDFLSNCSCYMNVKTISSCRAKKCVKSVTFSDLPQSVLKPKPNYVNIDFAESLKFYENCKDCYNKLFDELEEDRVAQEKRSPQDLCSSCDNCLGVLAISSTHVSSSPNRPLLDESPGYIRMSALANIMTPENTSSCSHVHQSCEQPRLGPRSRSSLCLHTAIRNTRSFRIRAISDPEINLIPQSRKRSKIALSKIIDLIRNVRPVTAQEIQRHAKKPSLPSYKNRTEESQYHSDDTLSSDTIVNTTNDISLKGSLNSICSESARPIGVARFLSASELQISSINGLAHAQGEEQESEMQKYKDHLRSLEIPQLPLDLECLRHEHSGFSTVRRSCTLTFKPGHNRDSSSSNDSGVSTASLRMRRADFTEFEMPVTTSLSAKLLREYALSQSGKSSSDLSLPRRSKSIDPLRELVFQFQDSATSAKSTSALLNAVNGKDSKQLRFIDAPSTSSGTSDLSDYMDNLSISSYSSNDHPRMSRCPATTLKPRSGKEYHKIDRLNLKPNAETAPEDQQSI